MIRALGGMAIPLPLFTDCCFSGVGENDAPLLIAVERKKITDLVSCITDGRFINQMQICGEMGCDVMVLIVEGDSHVSLEDGLLEVPIWRRNSAGKLVKTWVPVRPTMTFSRFDQFLTEVDYLAGVIVKRSWDVRETASIIKALWDNFQTPPGKHNSLNRMFTAPPTSVELVRPGLIRRMAKELPGIGWKRSRVVAAHFRSVRDMCNAKTPEWTKLDGISRKVATEVVNAINDRRRV